MGNNASKIELPCKWKDIFTEIYFNEFRPEKYLLYNRKKLEESIQKLNWNVTKETLLQKLKICYNNGYCGFHFIDGYFATDTVVKYISEMFDNTYYIDAYYCEKHNKMCLNINPHALNISIKDFQFSFTERNAKVVDFCYDFN